MATVKINPKNQIGKIKPMHAVGQPPIGGQNLFGYFHYLTEIGVPYSRLHDVGGCFGAGKFVDVPNIFRDFDADVDDPASYDFTFTDALITALIESGIEPYYRLGVSIENNADIKVYRINPPKDVEKWAKICEHIVAHYNDGWANGYHYNITYWEVWNEPDDGERQSQMWNGTAEEYYRLYEAVSKRLKARFPNIKVGGYASISLAAGYKEIPTTRTDYVQLQYYLKFFHDFWKYVKEHNCPIDFYSWHCYADTEGVLRQAEYIHKCLVEYGYGDIECHLTEWHPCNAERATARHSAETASMMLAMQNKSYMDLIVFYDANLANNRWNAFFDQFTLKPTLHSYFSFAAFNFLYQLENQVELVCEEKGVYAVAAVNENRGALVISNISGATQELSIEGINLDDARWYVIDSKRLLSWSPECKAIDNNQVILVEFEVK